MSLDVYLTAEHMIEAQHEPESAIYIREDGRTRRISREEWNERFPGREPVVVCAPKETNVVYSANITHNLNTMADRAGIYLHLWRPEEIGISKARQLIKPLRAGLTRLSANEEFYRKFEPENGWGTYSTLVSFVQEYLDACVKYSDASVSVSR